MIVYIQESKNPAHRSLQSFMTKEGLEVRLFKLFFLPVRPGVVFIHFPELCVSTNSRLKMIIKFSLFIINIVLAKLLGSCLVWEVNNLCSHDHRFPVFQKILMIIFPRLLSGVIYTTESSISKALDAYPALGGVPYTVIPISNFRHLYPERGDASRGRRVLGVNEGKTILLAFGLIRRYKGADTLVEVFKQIEDTSLSLVIAGICTDPVYKAELERSARVDSRIRLIFENIPHSDVPHIYAASALACAPFREILNSGSVLLGLGLGCPVIAPRLGALPDLEEKAGKDWLMLYDGQLDMRILRSAIAWARSPRAVPPTLEFCDFETVATETVAFVRGIGGELRAGS